MKNILILLFTCFIVLGLNAQNGSYPNYDNDHQHEGHNNDHDHNNNNYYESEEDPYYNKNKEYRKRRKSKSKHNQDYDRNGGYSNDYHDDDYGYDNYGGNMYDQAVYWHLVPLGYNTFQLSYEMRHLSEDDGIRAWLFSGGITLSNKLQQAEMGFMGEVQYRYYFNKMGPNFELYGAPYAQFRKLSRERGSNIQGVYTESFDDITTFSGGILFGMHFFLFDQFIIELQGGGGFAISKIPSNARGIYGDNPWEVGYTGISVKGGINIGFAF